MSLDMNSKLEFISFSFILGWQSTNERRNRKFKKKIWSIKRFRQSQKDSSSDRIWTVLNEMSQINDPKIEHDIILGIVVWITKCKK